MNLYLIRYPENEPFQLDGELNYVKPDLPDKIKLSQYGFGRSIPSSNDMVLFYHTFVGETVAPQQTIFAYFQIAKIEKGIAVSSKTLSFDKNRCGAGVLNYSKKRALTRYGSPKNHWSFPEFFKCMNLTSGNKNLNSRYRENGGIRYFDNVSSVMKISPVPSRDSGVYFENALCEWISSVCEDVRSDATRAFNVAKKGSIGNGKTGFVKYSYRPDSRKVFYCRLNHTVGKRNIGICENCPMYKKEKGRHTCSWSLPLYDNNPYIPLTVADAYAYFDALLEKGLVMDYRD